MKQELRPWKTKTIEISSWWFWGTISFLLNIALPNSWRELRGLFFIAAVICFAASLVSE